MVSVQSSRCCQPTPFIDTASKLICGFAIIGIAISIIGLTATNGGPFNAIVQLGTTTHFSLLGVSIFVLIVDLVWISFLCNNKEVIAAPLKPSGALK